MVRLVSLLLPLLLALAATVYIVGERELPTWPRGRFWRVGNVGCVAGDG